MYVLKAAITLGRPPPQPHRAAGEEVAGGGSSSPAAGERGRASGTHVSPLCDRARFRTRVLAGRPGPACACAIPRVRARPTAAGQVEQGPGSRSRGTGTRVPGRACVWVRRRRGQPGILGSGAAAGSSRVLVSGARENDSPSIWSACLFTDSSLLQGELQNLRPLQAVSGCWELLL